MTHSKSTLVVDDDSDQAQEMADALIRAGYAVRTASSGDEAFAELLSVPPPLWRSSTVTCQIEVDSPSCVSPWVRGAAFLSFS